MTPTVVPDRCPQCGADLPPVDGERVTCSYCGSSLIRVRAHPQAEQAPSESEEAPADEGWGLRMRCISHTDQQGIGMEVFRLLIPADWDFEGGVRWVMNNPGMPATIAFRAYNPDGVEAFEVFPNLPFYWTNNPMVTSMFPVGSTYYGNEVRPPVDAVEALQELVVPRHRGGARGLRVTDREQLPELARQMQAKSPIAPTGVTSADGARVRIQYQLGNREAEEEIFGVVEVSQVSTPMFMGAMQNIFWMADYLFSFRAAAGQLDDLDDLFLAILRSFRLNPAWYARYLQVSQYMVQHQIQQIHHIGQISQIISQTSDQISEMVMSSYQQRQETLDHMADQFSQAIRGVDEYQTASGSGSVELPGGYERAWSNGIGEYILTNDVNFDPNRSSTVNWEPLERTS